MIFLGFADFQKIPRCLDFEILTFKYFFSVDCTAFGGKKSCNKCYRDKAVYKVCIRSNSGHSWIYAQNLTTGVSNSYGRWKIGFGNTSEEEKSDSGVRINTEKDKVWVERCIYVMGL